MNFMLIQKFSMYFADFRANFCVLTDVLFSCRKWVLKRPLLLEQNLDNNRLHFFCRYKSFFCC